MRSIRVFCFVAAMCISALAFGQEPPRQTPKMGSKEWAELEKTLWDVDQQWLCSAGATPNKTPVSAVTSKVNANTRQSMEAPSNRGTSPGLS